MAYDKLNNPTRLAAIVIHRLLNQAAGAPEGKKPAAYYIVFRAVLQAHKKDELREDVRKRFSEECPKAGSKQFAALHGRFQKEIMGIEPRGERNHAPAGKAVAYA